MLGQSTIGGTTGIQRFLLVVPSLLRWKRPPVLIISTSSPSYTRTRIDSEQAQEESAAEAGHIPTAQAIYGIYAEA
ncbi:hypothetical protein FOXYSP1_08381 [Fusarium oxysporum f. sp. phaseoli]